MNNAPLQRHGPWLLVALTAIAVYANSLANGFALDDVFIIQLNNRVHQLADQSIIWLRPYWPSYGVQLGLYRPFAIFMYAVQWAISGGAPLFFHACNVLLHALASVLAFFLLRALIGSAWPALLGGLLFAVHPVRTEAVANLVGQAELIAGAATFAACLLWVTRPPGPAASWARRLGVLAVYCVAVLTKESAIVLPGLLVALDMAQGRVVVTRDSLRGYVVHASMPLLLLLAAAVGYLALRVDVLGSLGGVDAAPSLPFLREHQRIPTALRAWPEYVRLLFFPADLAADYSPAVILPVEGISPMALLGVGLLLGTIALALLTPVVPAAGLPAAWFFISVLPVSNLLLPVGVVVAERLLYTPAFAVSLIAGFAWRALLARTAAQPRPRRLAFAAASCVLALMAGRTVLRNPDWKDTPAVWDAIVRDHPESYRAQWIESARAYAAGDPDRGLQHLELAYRLWPNDSQLLNELASQLIGLGQHERALALLERSRQYVDWVNHTEILLAHAAVGARQYQRALDAVIRADRMGANPAYTFPVYAQAYEGLGRMPAAVGAWRAILRLPRGDAWLFWSRLGRALANTGDPAGGLAAADSARRRIEPADTAAARVVGALRDAIGRGCYAHAPSTRPASDCADPIGEWQALATQAVFFANNSQNASPAGTGVGGGRPERSH